MGDTAKEDPVKKLARLLKQAASEAIAEGDPWAKHQIDKVPAERVIRHMYQPETQTWKQDETIVKMQTEPFTHGAMRHCYRMKKRSPPPQSASNHRFHQFGWTRASNYVAKAYHDEHGKIDVSEEAKENVRNDILLQYEASHWSDRFNDNHPPKKIIFIRAYAIEFPDREGKPWFAVERYIFGNDMYGAGFAKHNTNAGFVDENLHRITPQVFSAFSFYESEGTRLVADIQGVGDMFTDPQVLSNDYRFGDGDLGPRGMALFFHSFRHNTVATALGIPFFPLSKSELNKQSKYEDEFFRLVGDKASLSRTEKDHRRFSALDHNRNRRKSIWDADDGVPEHLRDTERRSNLQKMAEGRLLARSLSRTLSKSLCLKPSRSEADEVQMCLKLAKEDYEFDARAYFRQESGELVKEIQDVPKMPKRSSLLIRNVSAPMVMSETVRRNLGSVHYQLAVLHGIGRFADQMPSDQSDGAPSHDVFSVLFHLSHAASLRCVPACLALGRVLAGLGSCVSDLLESLVPVDFEAAKLMLKRAMESDSPLNAPKVAAGCILYQIHTDEAFVAGGGVQTDDEEMDHSCTKHTIASDLVLTNLLEEIFELIAARDEEHKTNAAFKTRAKKSKSAFHVGDKVEGNYFLEGNYYPGVVESISEDGTMIHVTYDDDGTTEALPSEHVRLVIPPTATQTALGGPLTDEEAGFGVGGDETVMIEPYQLRADLAKLKEKAGDLSKASALYEEAAQEAMESNKMKLATELSLKAAELLQ